MGNTIKKLLSVLLAVSFLFAVIPFSGLSSAATGSEVTLGDGSVWLAELGSDVTFESITEGDYKISTAADSSAASNFKLMPKQRISALTGSVSLSCDYRGGAASFGFSTDYSVDNVRSSENSYGKVEFYRVETGNSTTIRMYIDGAAVDLKTFTATRATMREIKIAESSGSYYLSYGGNIIDAAGCPANVQEAVKLENYFPEELLANDGLLYFFCTAETISAGNGARILMHNSFGDYSRNYSHTFSGDTNTPSAWIIPESQGETTYEVIDGYDSYVFNAGSGGTSTSLGIPVATVPSGSGSSEVFWVKNALSATPSDNRYNYYEFSNDPTFPAESTEKISVIYALAGGATAHVSYNGQTIGCLNLLNGGAWYNCRFISDGVNITGFEIITGQFGGTLSGFGKLEVGKPVYMRVSKEYYPEELSTIVMFADGSVNDAADALNASITAAASESDINAAKAAANEFYASPYRYAASYEAEAAASDIFIRYYVDIVEAVNEIEAAIAALPPVDELVYQDKLTIEGIRDMYDALSDEAKALVTSYELLLEYEEAAALLEDDGLYRTDDGNIYRVVYDPEAIKLGSDETNGALTAKLLTAQSASNTYFTAVTQTKFPILSGKYELSQYFGTGDNSARFGFAADDYDDIIGGKLNNSFVMYRTEAGNNTIFYTLVDGVSTECYSCVATRARIWTVGVTKINGSYYVTVDGTAITGEGYSDEVKEALKLENHFDKEFLENNYSVHFFIHASTMHGDAYLRPTVTVENNLVIDTQDLIGDRNGGISQITDKNVPNSSYTSADGSSVYNFDVPSAGSVIIGEPVDITDGFSVRASMPTCADIQGVQFTFSNDPNFLSGDQVSFEIIQFTDGTNTILYSGIEQAARFSGFYSGQLDRTISFVEQDGVYKLRVFTPGSEQIAAAPDFTALVGKPVYLKLTGSAVAEPNMTVTTKATGSSAYTDMAAVNAATETYLAGEATEIAAAFDTAVAQIYGNRTDYFLNRDQAEALMSEYSAFSERQKSAAANYGELTEINNYLISLAYLDAPNLVICRQLLLGQELETAESYDFYHDDTLDILDMIRMKKAIADDVKKN